MAGATRQQNLGKAACAGAYIDTDPVRRIDLRKGVESADKLQGGATYPGQVGLRGGDVGVNGETAGRTGHGNAVDENGAGFDHHPRPFARRRDAATDKKQIGPYRVVR